MAIFRSGIPSCVAKFLIRKFLLRRLVEILGIFRHIVFFVFNGGQVTAMTIERAFTGIFPEVGLQLLIAHTVLRMLYAAAGLTPGLRVGNGFLPLTCPHAFAALTGGDVRRSEVLLHGDTPDGKNEQTRMY